MARALCGRPVQDSKGGRCQRERGKGIQRCRWHWLKAQTPDIQAAWADARLSKAPEPHRARVPKEEWPPGERWCAGCQSFVPVWYATGSRCKACASRAAHASRVKSVYGLEPGEYEELLAFQGGRCYICRRRPGKIRLAVDHDHQTNQVRGLLCANNENGCNRAIIANLEGSEGGGRAAAQRVLDYLTLPPYARMKGVTEREVVVALSVEGCCGACSGTGVSGEIETNGLCWDCRGTGHAHAGPCEPLSAPLPAQEAPRDPWGPDRPPPPF